ncbi:hypothetical protein B0T25DRAFT_19159 [Lasiosphaeria hispida]|uniref:Uncharacterized protein n=1 Tax=Lasiosphaeria hispida TaxID=260671 RepID=A0AAJ0HTX9_9PEZI|nr:hypothetical protein B0T25DRAFT_19159 [Lasiosphaeria hispida]
MVSRAAAAAAAAALHLPSHLVFIRGLVRPACSADVSLICMAAPSTTVRSVEWPLPTPKCPTLESQMVCECAHRGQRIYITRPACFRPPAKPKRRRDCLPIQPPDSVPRYTLIAHLLGDGQHPCTFARFSPLAALWSVECSGAGGHIYVNKRIQG